MNYEIILIILFLLIALNFLMIIYIFNSVGKLKKYITKNDLTQLPEIINHLKNMIIESERVSEKIDNTLKEKESLLEDLSDIIDAKLEKFYSYTEKLPETKSLKEHILALFKSGKTPVEIARQLEISITEINIVLKMYGLNADK